MTEPGFLWNANIKLQYGTLNQNDVNKQHIKYLMPGNTVTVSLLQYYRDNYTFYLFV